MKEFVHIVCLDVPEPPDYGGAIDMYYKILSLYNTGKKIILHCFQYKENRHTNTLSKYCTAIYTYERKPGFKKLVFSGLPYIVSSRINKNLISKLNEDDFPIILEGIHTTGVLPYLKNKNRNVVVRIHNDEAIYYSRLAQLENALLKRCYYFIESKLLAKYQRELPPYPKYACIAETDISVLKNRYNLRNLYFIPAFTPWQELNNKSGKGLYCLYHGNMSIAENEQMAMWLLENVFTSLNIPFVIAGKSISKSLKEKADATPLATTHNNPSEDELDSLIQNAHINIVPSLNSTGIKLKLLHALFQGRFCISNNAGIAGTGIDTSVELAEKPENYKTIIKSLFEKTFDDQEIKNRRAILDRYSNQLNVQKLIDLF